MTARSPLDAGLAVTLVLAVVASLAIPPVAATNAVPSMDAPDAVKDGTASADSAASQAAPTVEVSDGSVVRGRTTNLSVTLDAVPNGLSGGTLTLALDSPAVGEIRAFRGGDGLTVLNATVEGGGGNVTVRLADLDDGVTPGDGPVTLGTLEVEATEDGTTGVAFESVRLDDDEGGSVGASPSAGTLSVESPDPTTLRVNTDSEAGAVELSLSSVPSGLSGFRITVATDGGRVEGASYGSVWKQTNTTVSEDGRSVTVRAVDLDDAVRPGESNVSLVTIPVEDAAAVSPSVTVHRLPDDTGHRSPHVVSKTRDADGTDGTDGSPSDGTDAESGDDGADGGLSGCASESAAASDLQGQFTTIGNLIIFLIAAVAVPNGAYGLFEWMTAGSNVRQGRKGKKRVRNTFVALAGAAVLKVAVNLTTAVLCV